MKEVINQEEEQASDDKFRIAFEVDKAEQLSKIVESYLLDIEHVHTTKGKRQLEATAFATAQQIKALEQENIPVKVYENLSEIGRKRQEEVGKSDRFEGGKIAPKGLGIKK